MAGTKRDSVMANLSWPDAHRSSDSSSSTTATAPVLPSSVASSNAPPGPSSMKHDGACGSHSAAAPPHFVNESTDAADLAPDPTPAPGIIRLAKHQLTFILQRGGNEEDFQVMEHNMFKGEQDQVFLPQVGGELAPGPNHGQLLARGTYGTGLALVAALVAAGDL
eukprot:s181_g9.t1